MATPLERQIATAKQYGYSDAEIQSYLQGGGSRIGDVVEEPARPEAGLTDYTAAERRQLGEGQPIERQVDRSQGADFLERLSASFKLGPRERADYFRKQRGEGNVVVTPGGEMLLRDRNDPSRWNPVDPDGLELGDVADFAGDIPGLAAMALVPGATALRAAGATGLGEVARQVIGALLPGSEEAKPLERAGSVAASAAGGGAAQGAVNLMRRGSELPGQAGGGLMRKLTGDVQPAVRERGLELEKEVGGRLLPSQLTGSRNLSIAEGFIRRNPFAAEKMANFELEQQMAPVQRRAAQILEKMAGGGGAGADELGGALRETMRGGIERAWNVTNSRAALDFAPFQAATHWKQRIPLENYTNGLREIIEKFGSPEFGASANSIAKQAREILRSLNPGTDNSPNVTPAKLQDMLRFLGQSAYGRAPSVFKDVPVPFSREIAQDLHKLLRADLSVAADTAGDTSMAALLRQARANYETNIGAVHELQNSLLSRYLGKNPDQMDAASIAGWFLRQKPGTIKSTLEVLSQTDPGVANVARAHVLERAIVAGREAAEKDTAKYGVREGRFALDAFLKNLPEDDVLTALYGAKGQSGAQVRQEIQSVIEFAERATYKGASGTIQEPGFRQLMQISKNPLQLAKFLETFGARGLAQAVTDPVARKAFIGLAEAKNPIAMRKAAEAVERVLPSLLYEAGRQLNTEADPNRGE